MQSVPITTNVVSSNPAHGEVYSIQNYVIKFVSDLRQVSGFFPGIPVSNRIGGVMVSVLASSAGSSPGRVKPKTIKLVFVASPLSTQH